MKLTSELMNAHKKLLVIQAQLERTLRQIEQGKYGEGLDADMDDIAYALGKVTEAADAIEGRL